MPWVPGRFLDRHLWDSHTGTWGGGRTRSEKGPGCSAHIKKVDQTRSQIFYQKVDPTGSGVTKLNSIYL